MGSLYDSLYEPHETYSKRKIKFWIENFEKFTEDIDLELSLKEKIILKLRSDDNIKNMLDDSISDATSDDMMKIESFFSYLRDLKNVKDKKYWELALKYALSFEKDTTFIDKFIKFITVTNYNDLKIIDNLDIDKLEEQRYNSKTGIRIRLGGLTISRLGLFDIDDEGFISFLDFHNRRGLKQTGLGTKLMFYFLEKIQNSEKYKNFGIYGGNVNGWNEAGIKFYKKFGFEAFDYRE